VIYTTKPGFSRYAKSNRLSKPKACCAPPAWADIRSRAFRSRPDRRAEAVTEGHAAYIDPWHTAAAAFWGVKYGARRRGIGTAASARQASGRKGAAVGSHSRSN
jgi:hypothetical protein